MRYANTLDAYTNNSATKGRIFHLPNTGVPSQSELMSSLQDLHASLQPEEVFAAFVEQAGKHLPLCGLQFNYNGKVLQWGDSNALVLARPFIWHGQTGVLKYFLHQPVQSETLRSLAQIEYLLQQPMLNAFKHEDVRHQAMVDSLTGLGNRRDYERAISQAIARNCRADMPLSLLILDLDNFKTINDTYGHGVGDKILREFGQLLSQTVRNSDQAFRLGGDEFVILVEGNIQGCALLCQRIMSRMARHQILAKYDVHTSLGGAQYQDGSSSDTLYRAADKALYQAKNAGRNSYKLAG